MYKVTINTESYKKMRCSKNTWEKGTINNFMDAINGWNTIENDLQEVTWRIQTFAHNFLSDNWDDKKEDYTEKLIKWRSKTENKLTYLDVLCDFERTTDIEVYGFAQGYFDIEKVLKELEENGTTKIPFKWCYDLRQYLKNYDGCYMQITKI
jgi:hypothetical protein